MFVKGLHIDIWKKTKWHPSINNIINNFAQNPSTHLVKIFPFCKNYCKSKHRLFILHIKILQCCILCHHHHQAGNLCMTILGFHSCLSLAQLAISSAKNFTVLSVLRYFDIWSRYVRPGFLQLLDCLILL